MKLKIVTIVLAVIFVSCMQNKTTEHFTINASVKGLKEATVFLKKFSAAGFQLIDSVSAQNGSFRLSGNVPIPEYYRIYISGIDGYIPVFIENKAITVVADVSNLNEAKVTGSSNDSIFKTLLAQLDSLEQSAQPIFEAYNAAKLRNNLPAMEKFEIQIDSALNAQTNVIKKFVTDNPKSPVAAFVLLKYLSGEMEFTELQNFFNNIDTSLQASETYAMLKAQIWILQKTQIGQHAPDFSLPDTTGTSVALSTFAGKYVLIDFWASWCKPCRAENPNVVEAFRAFSAKGFTVLGVSLDSKHDKWVSAIKADKLTWTHVSDLRGWDNEAAILYGIRAIPSNYLIDPKGIIVGKNLRGADLLKKLHDILK